MCTRASGQTIANNMGWPWGKILLDEILRELKSDFGANPKSQGTPFQFLRMTLPEGPQIIEAYDCHQGSSWHDGLNLVPPSKVLETQTAKLTTTEQDQYNLCVVGSISEGRKLMTTKGCHLAASLAPFLLCPLTCGLL